MAQSITSADLRHKVVFKQPTSSLNDEAGIEKTFATALTTWAAVRGVSSSRVTEANSNYLVDGLDFYVRYSSQIEPVTKDWLIEYKAENYTIHEIVVMDQENRFVRFTAKVRTNG